ncbi:MAG: helix-turn-helix domain-containing protein [Nitrospirae bacterium]|nr:helix-turn-helix domain-containing protein [Nitrospirota bacterium]
MKKKPKEPFIPVERHETVRQKIISVLEGQTLSAKDISADVMVSEKEVYEHLKHIQKTLNKRDRNLIITPAECKKCGFVFRKRDRLKKPGRCPVCRGELISEPLFSIKTL